MHPMTRRTYVIMVMLLVNLSPDVKGSSLTVCERNAGHLVFNMALFCPNPSHVIRIEQTLWGREDTSGATCPSTQAITDQTCDDDETAITEVKTLCNAKTSCSIPPTNEFFGDPCEGVYKYLKVDYTCRDLECRCEGSKSAAITTFDEGELAIVSVQKTLISMHNASPSFCKYKLRAVTSSKAGQVYISSLYFSFGKHGNRNKFLRDYIISSGRLMSRGTRISLIELELPVDYTTKDGKTRVTIDKIGNILQLRSPTCSYALDVDVSTDELQFVLYTDFLKSDKLKGMCGACNGPHDEYVLPDGTDLSNDPDKNQKFSDWFKL